MTSVNIFFSFFSFTLCFYFVSLAFLATHHTYVCLSLQQHWRNVFKWPEIKFCLLQNFKLPVLFGWLLVHVCSCLLLKYLQIFFSYSIITQCEIKKRTIPKYTHTFKPKRECKGPAELSAPIPPIVALKFMSKTKQKITNHCRYFHNSPEGWI